MVSDKRKAYSHEKSWTESEDEAAGDSEGFEEDSRVARLSSVQSKRRKTTRQASLQSDEDDDSKAVADLDQSQYLLNSKECQCQERAEGLASSEGAPKLVQPTPIGPTSHADLSRVATESAPMTGSYYDPEKTPIVRHRPTKSRKPGVVYFSRLPPSLPPLTLRHHLSQVFGPITNLFLTPEPQAARNHRTKTLQGSRRRKFTDGWVEFARKKDAKICVESLNGRTTAEGLGIGGIGARKKGKAKWYRDDVWSLRYLKGFTWDDLMAGVRGEEREREERVRLGIAREKEDREMFNDGVRFAKVEETRHRKREARKPAGKPEEALDTAQRSFKQKEVVQTKVQTTGMGRTSTAASQGSLQRVLSKIL